MKIDNKLILINEEDYKKVSKYIWYFTSGNYIATKINGEQIYLTRFLLSPKKIEEIDHKNGNPLDNRKENLRICTRAQNNQHRKKFNIISSSLFKGVYKRKQGIKNWAASIKSNGKRYFLGYFKSEIEAAKSYDIKAKELHKEFAVTNF